ncbi:hypothetical protein BD410DRAFT_796585 [Rickenella mellea]|uniref:Uncharacterized protein n=1 Tax=Rickenella mellea TaxID=50990 RepID=A0A4Y7PIY5_9AGAM|nr:hypothetical protein BD410DRAFT_796585 [Rickenella mellea]
MYFSSKSLSASLCAVTFLIQGAKASLFPVQPVEMTVFHAGRSESVRWIDVGSHPKLSGMGKMNIDLYVNGTYYLTTLASDVDPQDFSHNVTISPSLCRDGSDYHMRFIFKDPPNTIYSADFTMADMTGTLNTTNNNPSNNSSATASTNATSTSISYVNITLVLPSTTVTSQIPSYSASPIIPVTTVTFPPSGSPTQKSGASASGRRLRAEKAQVKIMVVLWPFLIGVALAL